MTDPCIPLVAAARVFRVAGQLDTAELQLNAAAGVFRDLRQPNTSRAYRSEGRKLAYARFAANERHELAKALATQTQLAPPIEGDFDWTDDYDTEVV